jgi:hypothetical protein
MPTSTWFKREIPLLVENAVLKGLAQHEKTCADRNLLPMRKDIGEMKRWMYICTGGFGLLTLLLGFWLKFGGKQ